MKIITFEKMLAMPVGTVFCLVDVPDDFTLGHLCCKEETLGETFEYRYVGSRVALPDDLDERYAFVDRACDEIVQGNTFTDAHFDNTGSMVEDISENPLCMYVIYGPDDLNYLISACQTALTAHEEA